MKSLVTGASGFLGSWLVKKLISEGHEVRVLHRSSSDLSQLEGLTIEHTIGDVTDLASLHQAMNGIDYVFHLAGLIGYTKSLRDQMEKVNVNGTNNVLIACQQANIKRLIYMSSVVAIGGGFNNQSMLDETSDYNLLNLNLGYFETKRKGEALVKHACDEKQIDAVILNPTTVYGPGDARKGSRKTQLKVAQGKFPFYTDGGVNVANVNDIVDATYNALEMGRCGERYILGGENISIKKLLTLIAKDAGIEPPKYFLPNFLIHLIGKSGDLLEQMGKKGPLNSENAWTSTMFHWFNSDKAQKELNLHVTPAKESIHQSVSWMRENHLI